MTLRSAAEGKTLFYCIIQAVFKRLLTSAIHLLYGTGTFACCISALGLCVPTRPGPVRSYLANLVLIIYTEQFCELSHINIILSPIYCIRVGGVKVSIVAFQAIDPGSIPG